MMRSTDPDLIERARKGDKLAFRDLVDIHQRFAINLAFRFTGDRMEAEDVAQEVFVSVWRHLPDYRTEVKFTTWLYALVTNRSLDYLKSSGRRQRLRQVDLSDHHPQAARVDESQELLEVVAKLAGQLPEKQQSVFVLRDLQGLTGEEVAEVLAIKPDVVKSNLYHARLRMRELIRVYENEKVRS